MLQSLNGLAQKHHQVVKSTNLRFATGNSMCMAMSHQRRRMKAMVTSTITVAQHSMMKYMVELLDYGLAPLRLR
jgi:hypothetical protein